MLAQFHFKNLEIESSLESRYRESANRCLQRLLDLAPPQANAVGLLEKQENAYRCSIDIYSTQGPFIASTLGSTPLAAIEAAETRLRSQLDLWWSNRRAALGEPNKNSQKIIEAVS